jgi:hypothetical protein
MIRPARVRKYLLTIANGKYARKKMTAVAAVAIFERENNVDNNRH